MRAVVHIKVVVALLCISCSYNKKESVNTDFFDIEEFVDQQTETDPILKKVTRRITIDEKTEQKTFEDYESSILFNILRPLNINNPKLYDKYNVSKYKDSTVYSAISPDESISKFKIISQDNRVKEIWVDQKIVSLISKTQKQYRLVSGKSLEIKNVMSSQFKKDVNSTILWSF